MKKTLGGILTVAGAICLVIGVAGLFGRNFAGTNPYVFAILGIIFFIAGISLVKTIRASEVDTPPRK